VWKLLGGTHRLEQFGVEKLAAGTVAEAQWLPMVSLVDGRLLRAEIQETTSVAKNLGLVSVYASAQFRTERDGAVNLQLEGASKADVWIDGKPAPPVSEIRTTLPAGSHTLVLRIDARDLPEQLRLRSGDVTFGLN
jgi:hypothetical protein